MLSIPYFTCGYASAYTVAPMWVTKTMQSLLKKYHGNTMVYHGTIVIRIKKIVVVLDELP